MSITLNSVALIDEVATKITIIKSGLVSKAIISLKLINVILFSIIQMVITLVS